MPPVHRLRRLARLATLPETRGLIVAAARSPTLRTVARRSVADPRALLRDLANPANARHLARSVVRHPAVAELANAGLVVLPVRYVPVGWVATWVARRVLRRFIEPPVEVIDVPLIEPAIGPRNVTPEASGPQERREGLP